MRHYRQRFEPKRKDSNLHEAMFMRTKHDTKICLTGENIFAAQICSANRFTITQKNLEFNRGFEKTNLNGKIGRLHTLSDHILNAKQTVDPKPKSVQRDLIVPSNP